MLEKANIDRLDLSEQMLAYWEQLSAVGTLSVENLPLALNEVKTLEAYRPQSPARVDNLVRRFQTIADRLRGSVN